MEVMTNTHSVILCSFTYFTLEYLVYLCHTQLRIIVVVQHTVQSLLGHDLRF